MELAGARTAARGRVQWAASVPSALTRLARSPLWGAAAVLLLAAQFRLGGLAHGRENYFYDAAVRSMSQSWHNFFFGAFDPSGTLSVDKPPLDLWLQVASVKLLGYSVRSLILPAALAGTLAAPLLYDAVRRLFGVIPGLCAGVALAVVPVSVVTARSDGMDALMMLLAVLAFWLVVIAVQRGQARYLYLAGVAIGLAFNVKLFEALVPLPALIVLYLVAAKLPLRRRVRHAAAACALVALVGLSWAIAVSLSPARSRPYPIGSTNGSVWNEIFVYNGIDRVSPPAGPAPLVHQAGLLHGTAGLWLAPELVAAFVFGALALIAVGRIANRGAVAAIAVWLVTGTVLFDHMTNLRVRYLDAFTPAVAVALGAGAGLLAARSARGRVAAAAALAVGLVASPLALHTLGKPPAPGPGPLAIAAGAAAVALALAASLVPRARQLPLALPIAALAMVSLLAHPVSTSAQLVRRHVTDDSSNSPLLPTQEAALERFLRLNSGGVAAAAPAKAETLIANTGRAVLMLTSYKGRPAVTVAQLRADVLAGRARWFVMDHRCTPSTPAGCAPPVQWVAQHGRDVTRLAGIPGRGVLFEVRASATVHARTTTRRRLRRSALSRRDRRESHPATRVHRRRS
jgi:4-amino-4-deoxy-L-arabinose transferase-like glycosyltransferase